MSAKVERMAAAQNRAQVEDFLWTIGPSGTHALEGQYGSGPYRATGLDARLRQAWIDGQSLLDRHDHGVLLPADPRLRERVQEAFDRDLADESVAFLLEHADLLGPTGRITAVGDGVLHYVVGPHSFRVPTASLGDNTVARTALRLSEEDVAAIQGGALAGASMATPGTMAYALESAAAGQGVSSRPAAAGQTTILGENMRDRVIPFAAATGARTLPWGTTPARWAQMTPQQRYRLNDGTLRARINEGDSFRYIGVDPGRPVAERYRFDLTRSELLRLSDHGIPYEVVTPQEVISTIGRP
jgi:hypothetical protein